GRRYGPQPPPQKEGGETHLMTTSFEPALPVGELRKQHHPTIEQGGIGGTFIAPVLLDRRQILVFEGMRQRIEPEIEMVDRQDRIILDVKAHSEAILQAISREMATGQWSDAFGRSQPTRGKRSTSCPGGNTVRHGCPLRTISGTACELRSASEGERRM